MPNVILSLYYLFLLTIVFSIYLCLLSVSSSIHFYNISLDYVFSIIFDYCSITVLLMLFICGSSVIPFIFHYMGSYNLGWNLFCLILLFISVMVGLVCSGDLFLSLVFWEYLGLVSYLLILFLCNYSSARSALITLFASRFGDVALFLLVSLGVIYGGSSYFYGALVLLTVLTKSAAFPFISWLLEAMRAPTPVSCLVHSSTLVAAGVWFGLRYNYIVSDSVNEFIFCVCIYTILVTALAALFFTDLKKLVALSTCNNISWCLLCLCLGDLSTSLLFLLSHGVAKCMLFIFVGDLMSSSGSSQSGVGVFSTRYSGILNGVLLTCLVSSLCGMPYLGVFLSKHILLDISSLSHNVVIYFFCCLGVCFSFGYSYRFIFFILGGVSGLCSGVSMNFCIYIMVFLVPSILSLILDNLGLFFHGYCSYPVFSSLFVWIHFIGLILGFFCYLKSDFKLVNWCSFLGGCDYLVGLFYWFSYLAGCFFSIVNYRWELFLIRGFHLLIGSRFSGLVGLSGLNLMILGFVWLFSFYFIVS